MHPTDGWPGQKWVILLPKRGAWLVWEKWFARHRTKFLPDCPRYRVYPVMAVVVIVVAAVVVVAASHFRAASVFAPQMTCPPDDWTQSGWLAPTLPSPCQSRCLFHINVLGFWQEVPAVDGDPLRCLAPPRNCLYYPLALPPQPEDWYRTRIVLIEREVLVDDYDDDLPMYPAVIVRDCFVWYHKRYLGHQTLWLLRGRSKWKPERLALVLPLPLVSFRHTLHLLFHSWTRLVV